jgi:formylglycine-generating enzyme required for sulfatase activity
MWLGLAAALAVLGVGGYYYGVHLPEQRRLEVERQRIAAQAEQARVEAERLRIEAAKAEEARIERERREAAEKAEQERIAAEARARREREDAEHDAIVRRIESVADGVPRSIVDGAELAVHAYLAAAPDRHKAVTAAAWAQRRQAWEAARLAAARGGVIVRTTPAGAEVRVGAVAVEKSPVTLKDQKLGRHPVRIRMSGYEDWDGEIEVKENEFAELNVPLVRSMGRFSLVTEPAGLAFRIEGAERTASGTAEGRALELPTGRYALTVSRPGYADERRTVEIKRNEASAETVMLLGGGLELTSTPPGAEVFRTGRLLGRTPYVVAELPPGEYPFELKSKGYKNASTTVRIAARQTTRESLALEKVPYAEAGWPWTVPDLGLELVWIAPGTFVMGSPPAEGGRSDESPQTRVTLTKGFWLGRFEVTQGQWQALMGSNPSIFQNAGANAPVENVLWDHAMEFCRRLTERERAAGRLPPGYAYTLPTEAQWEYACRAGTTSVNYAGSLTIYGANNAPDLDAIAWYGGNSGVGYEGGFNTSAWPEKQYAYVWAGTHPVGQKRPNAWGLHDMLGNVWEWCADWYASGYPGGSVSDPAGPAFGTDHIYRGGSWYDMAVFFRSAFRGGVAGGYGIQGFRLALAPSVSN